MLRQLTSLPDQRNEASDIRWLCCQMECAMCPDTTISGSPEEQVYDKSTPGRGFVVVIYALYVGSIMAVVTAPVGVLIAHLRRGRGAAWLDTHLQFQIRTFWLGMAAGAAALLLWRVAGQLGLSPVYAWTFGYLFFTLSIVWMMGRCAVGVHRLTSNRPIDAPKSWLFGLGKQA